MAYNAKPWLKRVGMAALSGMSDREAEQHGFQVALDAMRAAYYARHPAMKEREAKLIPAAYLYLTNDRNELLAIFPFDHIRRELEVISYEAEVRAKCNVDDPESGLSLVDSRVRPLPADVLARAMREGKGRQR